MKKLLFCFLLTQSLFAFAQDAAPDEERVLESGALGEQASPEAVAEPTKTSTGTFGRKFSNFGISTYFIGGYSSDQFEYAKPSFGIFDSYISFNYRIDRDTRVSFMPAFSYTTAGRNAYGDQVTDKIALRDFSMAVTFLNVLEDSLPSHISLKFKPRLYLPTSDNSKDQGMIARLRLELESKYFIDANNFFRLYMKPSYYFQRNTVFYKTIPGKYSYMQTTPMADSDHGLEFTHRLNRTFALKPHVFFSDDWSNTSNVNYENMRKTYRSTIVKYSAGLEVAPVRNMNFTIIYGIDKDLIRTYKGEERNYTLLFNATLL